MTSHQTPETIELAQLLFPDVTLTPEDLEQKYPVRTLSADAMVTRFAPSPTGFVHLGGIFASLISKRLAEQSGGVFFLRIEDTDQKREIEGGIEEIVSTMHTFQVPPTEGVVALDEEVGKYGPYIQSKRKDIYDVYGKWLVAQGFAYPCFCTEAELESIAAEQEKTGLMKKGYFGKWAKHRSMTLTEVKENLQQGKGFVIRVKSDEKPRPARFKDLIRGSIEMEGNFVDTVLIKSSGLPTYHLAHVIDDHLMRTTHVTRGEEWMSSAPLHVQLFEMLGFKKPIYLHFSHIGKKENDSVRKLSKRKDPEAAMSSYTKLGYPPEAITEYLLNLINPPFDDWRRQNPTLPNTAFIVKANKIGKTIAIFDQKKLDGFSRDIISRLTASEVYERVVAWAAVYEPTLHHLFTQNPEYATAILNIERQQQQPRKDFTYWSDILPNVWYFFDEVFAEKATQFIIPEGMDVQDVTAFLTQVQPILEARLSKDEWMEQCRQLAHKLGFAHDLKTFKENPNAYKGHVGNVMTVLRLALTRETRTPDLYQVVEVLGKQRVAQRLQQVLSQQY